MFDSLKKKFSSWLGVKKEAPKKTKKKSSKKAKKKKSKAKEGKKEKKTKEILMPMEYNVAEHKYEPDSEKIKKIQKEISEVKVSIKEKEENLEEVKEESEGFFSKLIRKISTSKLSEEDFNELFLEFEIILLENNVALEAVDKIKEVLSKDLVGKQIKKSEAESKVLEALKESIQSVLIESPNLISQIKESKKSPFVILFFGINGSGKTTSIAKIAHLLQKNKISSVLAAGDTFRAASIEQLQIHAQKLNLPVIKQDYGSDPSAVAFDAIQYAKKNHIQVVLIDTAGRMYTKSNLLKEMEKIVRVSKPDLKMFVGESITGNDATEQAKTFNETAGIDGIILSKADVDEKAGAILSVSLVTSKPIYFLGVGQNYEDLAKFTKKDVLKHLGLE